MCTWIPEKHRKMCLTPKWPTILCEYKLLWCYRNAEIEWKIAILWVDIKSGDCLSVYKLSSINITLLKIQSVINIVLLKFQSVYVLSSINIILLKLHQSDTD